MNSRTMVEAQWDTFRCGIVDSVTRIDKHLRNETHEAWYGALLPWDRPGLLLTLTKNSLAMDVQRYPYSSNFANDLWVTMNANGFLRVKMYFPHGRDGVRTVEMKPEEAWSEQYPEVQKHGVDVLYPAQDILDNALQAILQGKPLTGAPSWEHSLRMDLGCLHALNIDTVRWTHWIETWGSDSMKAGLRVVQSLLGDPDHDPGAWRDALFASWDTPEMPTTSLASMSLDGLV